LSKCHTDVFLDHFCTLDFTIEIYAARQRKTKGQKYLPQEKFLSNSKKN
jgi:hypothetical protein